MLRYTGNPLGWIRHKQRRPCCVSYPKSGRTWLRVMLTECDIPLKYSHAGSGHKNLWHHDDLMIEPGEWMSRRLVFLFRDPRDVAVSGFFQTTYRVGKYEGSMEQFVLDPHHGIPKIVRFMEIWEEFFPRHGQALAVSYESLRNDPESGLHDIVKFLGRKLNPSKIAEIVERARLERMQAAEASGELAGKFGKSLAPGDVGNPDSFKVRRGKVGGFVDYISPDAIARADEIMAASESSLVRTYLDAGATLFAE